MVDPGDRVLKWRNVFLNNGISEPQRIIRCVSYQQSGGVGGETCSIEHVWILDFK